MDDCEKSHKFPAILLFNKCKIIEKEQMFEKCIDFTGRMTYYEIKEFRSCSCWNGGIQMNNEEYKKYIIEMIQRIDDNQHLKRIFNYVHKYFIRRTGK